MRILNYLIFFILFLSCRNDQSKKIVAKQSNQSGMTKSGNSFIVKDSVGKEYEIFELTEEDFEEKQSKSKLNFLRELSVKFGVEIYQLPDSRIIVKESSRYAMYPSLEVLTHIIMGYKGPTTRDVLFKVNPYGKEFPDHVDMLVSQLYADFGIIEKGKTTNEILKCIDENIIKNRNEAFFNKYYLNFIAVIGAICAREFGTKWEMILSDDNQTWSPLISLRQQNVYFAHYIREDFFNQDEAHPATEVFETIRDIIKINLK